MRTRLCVLLVVTLGLASCAPRSGLNHTQAKPDASDLFFAGPIAHLHLIVSDQDAERINQDGRPSVPCTILEKDAQGNTIREYAQVAIKLKGAAGSFQTFDQKPALTVRADKYRKAQLFHGLAKFHLNNSVQDETYLNEQICSELFLEAKVPAARVTHARVWINGRDLGLYVLKEGFDERFLARHFKHANGNLYDGGFCTDIENDLEKDSGEGPDDHSDLRRLREACAEQDPTLRAEQLAQCLDVDQFLTFVALELMTCHWDGYACNANNYRLYFEPTTRRAYVFPHGMDQMFGDPGFSIVNVPAATVAQAVLQHPPWREQFKARVNELLPRFSPPSRLLARVDALSARLQLVISEFDPGLAEQHAQRVAELKDRIVARAQSLEEQKTFPDPPTAEFDEDGIHKLADWRPASEVEDAVQEEIEMSPEQRALRIACGPSGHCIASWRTGLLLPRGRYTLTAQVTAKDIMAIADEKGTGAGLRISGANRDNQAIGTLDRQTLSFTFAIEADTQPVELVAELRATGGEILFHSDSLQLKREELPR